MKRAVDCAGCRWWREGELRELKVKGVRDEEIFCSYPANGRVPAWHFACLRGHRPRFYRPRSPVGDFGWKRRCGDYIRKELP